MNKLNRIDCIDGWRAIAAMGVLYTHLLEVLKQPRLMIGPVDLFTVLNILGKGVHLFFVISGFCFFLVMSRKGDFSLSGILHFWKKRWLRIAPAFYVACIVYGCFKFGHFSTPFAASLAANFIFLQPYIPGTEIAALFWSLSVEWLFYLMLPFLFIASRKIGVIPVILMMLGSGLLLNMLHFAGYIYANNFAWYYTIFANYEHFGWGILLGLVYERNLLQHTFLSRPTGFFTGVFAAYLGKLFFYAGFLVYAGKAAFLFESVGPLIMTLGFAMIILASLRNAWLNQLLSNRVLVFVGRISFSFYLWHLLVVKTCFTYFQAFLPEGAAGVLVLGLLTLIILIPLSLLSYNLFESFYFKIPTQKMEIKLKTVTPFIK